MREETLGKCYLAKILNTSNQWKETGQRPIHGHVHSNKDMYPCIPLYGF